MASTRRPRRNGGGASADTPPQPLDTDGRLKVLVEMLGSPGTSPVMAMGAARELAVGAELVLDEEFAPVPLGRGPIGGAASMNMSMGGFAASSGTETIVVRGSVADRSAMDSLRSRNDVVDVWLDTPIAPFPIDASKEHSVDPTENPAAAACPIPPCDCSPGTARGTMADVANYLGVSSLWTAGFRGTGIVVGVVDGGITAQGRPVKAGETTRRIPRVIGGWPVADWGTEAARWSEHGNMTSTDVLGMAPDAQVYDLRIAGPGDSVSTISRALQAFQWAIDRHRADGTPHILSNSWGIFQQSWDATYAMNSNHPFTRKVVEAIDEGIIVLFAAGNCGSTCPDGRCGPDNGPGRSIWGANSHPRVITVGAVNKNEQFVGYSSQGPGALDPNKPDFCSITHFAGYFTSDSGTSAATPILAGAVALIKQAKPSATHDSIKSALRDTAKDIGPAGFDQHSGTGIVQVKAAYDVLTRPLVTSIGVCGPSRITVCNATRVLCQTRVQCPSVITICLATRVTCVTRPCPTLVCATATCPTVTCPTLACATRVCPTRACPSLVCPSIACGPGGPGGGLGADGTWGEEETWAGWTDPYAGTEEEYWYGGGW